MASSGRRNSSLLSGQRNHNILTFLTWCACIIIGAIALHFLLPVVVLLGLAISGLAVLTCLGVSNLWDWMRRKGRTFFTPILNFIH